MLVGLALVLAMLGALSLGGIVSLFSYRSVVSDLDDSLRDRSAKEDFLKLSVRLNEPLLELSTRVESPTRISNLSVQREGFLVQLAQLENRLSDFKKDLDQRLLDPGSEIKRQLAVRSIVFDVFPAIDMLRAQEKQLADAKARPKIVSEMRIQVANVQLWVDNIPDFSSGFQETLGHARNAYHRGFWLIGGSSVVVLVLFFGLVSYGRHCVFNPLHKLHQGALRVAQGDFDYRVELPSQEEMAELAEAFNNMTDRFQEIRDDLDRQVREKFRQLVRSERLAGIGFLAAGVAHEINNPLQAIAFAAESLEGRTPEPRDETERKDVEVMRQYLGMIQREAFRCQQITRKLLEFSRGNGEARNRQDLTSIVNEVLALVRPMSKYQDRTIEFSRTAPCPIDANGPEIQQVVLNLVSNALEAMNPGGTLRIGIVEQAGQVVLNFSDDGCGMTPEVVENLFEPFFTQRKDGKGTGLGLSISHRIISDHGGTIDAASDGPGRGSTFRVILPRNSFRAGTAA